MNIAVKDLTSVDKEITITATREELEPAFNKAYKKYRSQVNLPGFRAGKAPVDIIRKRFGKDIEQEEARNYVLDVYNDLILEKHKPVGETQFKDIKWENDQLEAIIQIGVEPEFELKDLESVSVDRMVHDVTDEDVEKEINHMLDNESKWEETDADITFDCKVTADVQAKDKDGNLVEDDIDPDQEFDLNDPKNADYKYALMGKKVGDIVDAEVKHEDHSHNYQLTIKKVEKKEKIELTEELIKKYSNDQYTTEEDYRAFLKSRVQEYYDQTADTMLKNNFMKEYTEAHDIEVPSTIQEMLIKRYVDDLKKQYNITQDIDPAPFREQYKDRAINDSKWFFISQKLSKKFDEEIDLTEEDVDKYLEKQSAQMGYPVEALKNAYASNPNELENLRVQIREEKVYDKALELVTITDMERDAYQAKYNEQSAEAQEG